MKSLIALAAGACGQGGGIPPLPGQVFDFNPNDPALITEVGGEIQAIADAAGGAVVLTAASAGQRAGYGPNLNGKRSAVLSFADSTLLSSATGGAASGSSPRALFMVCSQVVDTITGAYEGLGRLGNPGAGQQAGLFEYGFDTNQQFLGISLVLEPQSLTYGPDPAHYYGRDAVYADSNERVVGYFGVGTEERLFVDGEIFREELAQTALTTLGPSLHLGGPVGGSGPASNTNVWRAVYAADGGLSDFEACLPSIDAWHRAVANEFDLWKDVRVIAMGNSLPYGQLPITGTTTGGAISYMAANSLVNGGAADFMNAGVSADYLSDTLAKVHLVATTRYTAMRRAGAGRPGNVLVLWAASNSLGIESGAAAYAELLDILEGPMARGYRCVVCTEIWRGDFNASQLQNIADYNTLVRAGAGIDFHACADLAVRVEFQSNTASYFEGVNNDQIHLGDGDASKGYGLAGVIIAAAINSVI